MGFYPQPNSWLCGPFALKHAMIALGVFENEWAIARAAGSDPGGTDERELARAARQFDCSVRMVRVHYPEDGREELVHHLAEGIPVLLCIEQWDHWVAVMHHEEEQFVLFDSRGPNVIRIMTWAELQPKWEYREQSGSLIYDLHPVVTRHRSRYPRALFSLSRAQWLAKPANAGLARQWSDYGRHLLPFGRWAGDSGNHDLFARPMSAALSEGAPRIAELLEGRSGAPEPEEMLKVMTRLRFVCETYDLHIAAEREADLLQATPDFVISRLHAERPAE